MIKFENVSKSYINGLKAVNNINLEIEDGEFFVFIGPSGSGKTTTLKMINRLHSLTEGTIYIDGKRISDYDIHELRWNIGYVLQQIALFPHMTIEENIAIVPELKKWDKHKIQTRITELLESVGLEPEKYRHRKPAELSGGEQQRVGVIRALAANPDIILMDEPFSALDPISRQKLQQDISNLQKRIKKTIVFVTHDMQEAIALGDRICLMQDGQVVQIDTPEQILKNPENDFVRSFLESGNAQNQWTIGHDYSVQDIIDESLYLKYDSEDGNLFVQVSDSLDKLIQVLANTKIVPVKNEDDAIIGTITTDHVMRFLSLIMERHGEHI